MNISSLLTEHEKDAIIYLYEKWFVDSGFEESSWIVNLYKYQIQCHSSLRVKDQPCAIYEQPFMWAL